MQYSSVLCVAEHLGQISDLYRAVQQRALCYRKISDLYHGVQQRAGSTYSTAILRNPKQENKLGRISRLKGYY